jgi:hypothetical protein
MKILYTLFLLLRLLTAFLFQDRNQTAYLLHLWGWEKSEDADITKEQQPKSISSKLSF